MEGVIHLDHRKLGHSAYSGIFHLRLEDKPSANVDPPNLLRAPGELNATL